jgi:hypothetical protein
MANQKKIWVFAMFRPRSDQAEDSDWINVLNAQAIFLDVVEDINLECHQNRKLSKFPGLYFF